MHTTRRFGYWVLLVALLGTANAALAQVVVVDLGGDGRAVAVSNSGQVVGTTIITIGEFLEAHAFSWTAAGGMVDLGSFGGSRSEAYAVNENGQVVGLSALTGGGYGGPIHAFLWTASRGMVDLGTLGGTQSAAYAVNENGQVVGDSLIVGDTEFHVFSWTASGGMVDLGTLGGTDSRAGAVNDKGQVVGESTTANGEQHAFSWTAAGGMVDLGTLGGGFSRAVSVNENGQVVGESTTANGVTRAFSWTAAGGMVDLGTLGGGFSLAAGLYFDIHSVGVNDNGQVVGFSATANGATHAFSWTAAGGMVDLGYLGGRFQSGAFRQSKWAGRRLEPYHRDVRSRVLVDTCRGDGRPRPARRSRQFRLRPERQGPGRGLQWVSSCNVGHCSPGTRYHAAHHLRAAGSDSRGYRTGRRLRGILGDRNRPRRRSGSGDLHAAV